MATVMYIEFPDSRLSFRIQGKVPPTIVLLTMLMINRLILSPVVCNSLHCAVRMMLNPNRILPSHSGLPLEGRISSICIRTMTDHSSIESGRVHVIHAGYSSTDQRFRLSQSGPLLKLCIAALIYIFQQGGRFVIA